MYFPLYDICGVINTIQYELNMLPTKRKKKFGVACIGTVHLICDYITNSNNYDIFFFLILHFGFLQLNVETLSRRKRECASDKLVWWTKYIRTYFANSVHNLTRLPPNICNYNNDYCFKRFAVSMTI